MLLDSTSELGYYAFMKEHEMTAKKNSRPDVVKPRKVVIDPKPLKNNVIYTEHLMPLVDMVHVEDDVLIPADDDGSFILQVRDETGTDSISKYGLFLGYADNDRFVPEVIVDEKGAYVLIFHDIT